MNRFPSYGERGRDRSNAFLELVEYHRLISEGIARVEDAIRRGDLVPGELPRKERALASLIGFSWPEGEEVPLGRLLEAGQTRLDRIGELINRESIRRGGEELR